MNVEVSSGINVGTLAPLRLTQQPGYKTVPFVVVRPDGMIYATGFCPRANVPLQAEAPNYALATTIDYNIGIAETHYVNAQHNIVQRPQMNITDSTLVNVDGNYEIVLTGLPIPCKVRVGSEVFDETDGEFTYETDIPGVYRIVVESLPYVQYEKEIVLGG